MAKKGREDFEPNEFVETHLECPKCGGSKSLSIREDGSAFCFAQCGNFPNGVDGKAVPASRNSKKAPKPVNPDVDQDAYQEMIEAYEQAEFRALKSRKLTLDTAERWGQKVRQNHKGEWEHLYPYRDDSGRIIDIKVRNTGVDGKAKEFYWMLGKKKRGGEEPGIYGLHLWENSGKLLVITEGELDAQTVSQAFGNQFSQGSVPNSTSGPKAIARAAERIAAFDRVVLWFDDDDPGRKAAEESARILPPGKVSIVSTSKGNGFDASDALQEGQSYKDITRILWQAPVFRPDGIVTLRDLDSEVLATPEMGIPWPWQQMTDWTYGRRYGEMYGFGAGTGQGKSDLVSQIIDHTCFDLGERCAIFAWEAGPAGYVKQLMGKQFKKRFHIPVTDPDNPEYTPEELQEAWIEYKAKCVDTLFLNNHRGATDWDAVKERIRYLVHSEGVKHIVLDPLTALSALADDERREMERLMAEASGLTSELNTCTYFTSHLATPDGTSHEEGGRVEMRHFKGSRAVGFWTNYAFGLERNQQAETEHERCTTTLRCLKDRYTGNALGKTLRLHYNTLTGSLEESAQSLVEFEGDGEVQG